MKLPTILNCIFLLFFLNSCGLIKDNSTVKPSTDFTASKIDVDLLFINQDIRIKGKNFKSNEQNIKITIGNADVSGIKVFNDSLLSFQVPQNAQSGLFKIFNKAGEKEIFTQSVSVYELENTQILNLPFGYYYTPNFKKGVTIQNNNNSLLIIPPSLMTRFVSGLENGGAYEKQMKFDNDNLIQYNQMILGKNFSQKIEEFEKISFTVNTTQIGSSYNIDPKYLYEKDANRLLLQSVQLKNNKFVYYFRDELIEYDIAIKKITRRLNIGNLGDYTYIHEYNNKLYIFEETKTRVINLNDFSIQIVNKIPFEKIIDASGGTSIVSSFAILQNSLFYTLGGKMLEFNFDTFEIIKHIDTGSNIIIIGTFENYILLGPTTRLTDNNENVSIYDLKNNKLQGIIKIKYGVTFSNNFYFINKCERLGYSENFQTHVDCQETNLYEIVVKKK